MLNEQTLEKLHDMRLTGMADAFKDQMMRPDMNDLSFEERFGFLVDQHWSWKEDRRLKTLLRNAKLKDNACIEDIDYKSPRGINKSLILSLSSCDWIKNAQNIILKYCSKKKYFQLKYKGSNVLKGIILVSAGKPCLKKKTSLQRIHA